MIIRELNKACGLALGIHVVWGMVPCPDNRPGCCAAHFGYSDDNGKPLPYYATDPTATPILLAEIERRGLQERYIGWFYKHVCTDGMNSRQEVFAILRATPEQHARAFIQTIEWNEAISPASTPAP